MRTLREDEHRGSTNEDAKIGHFEDAQRACKEKADIEKAQR